MSIPTILRTNPIQLLDQKVAQTPTVSQPLLDLTLLRLRLNKNQIVNMKRKPVSLMMRILITGKSKINQKVTSILKMTLAKMR